MRRGMLGVALMVSGVIIMVGCGGDDGGGGPAPITSVTISPGAENVELSHSTEISAEVKGGTDKTLDWYVNGILNGDEVVGSITQNSPATFTAPDSLPDPSNVLVKAVSREDTTKLDSCHITITFDKIFVDAVNGDDDTGTGCINLPVKSITHGLSMAEAGTKVIVQPGLYDQANGEVFAISIPQHVTLVGMDWETCIIRGHSDVGYESSVSVSSNYAAFRKFTVEEGEPVDPAWSVGIYVGGNWTLVDSIRVHDRGNYSVLRSSGTEGGVIQNLDFTMDNDLRQGRGFEIVFGNTGTVIRGCHFYGLFSGMFFNGETDAMVENCIFETVAYGVDMCCTGDPNHNPNPDLGGGVRGSTGGNVFTDYTNCGLLNPTSNDIYAKFNTWDNDPPVEGEDYCNQSDGSIVVE